MPFIFLKLHEKLPGLSRNPTFTAIIAGNAIHGTALVSSLKRAEYNGIPAFATRKLSGKMFAAGWRQGNSRRYCTAVILDVTKKAIFPALLFCSIVEPLTIWIIRAGRLKIGYGFVSIGGKPDIPIGRGIAGDRAQLLLMTYRERIRKHRPVAEAAGKNSRGVNA